MARSTHFRCQIITPERAVLDTEAEAVVFPAHDGQVGIMNHRAPMVCKMGVGICDVTTADATSKYFVDGGFARMLDNTLTLLTQDARTPDELDQGVAAANLESARTRSATTPEEMQARRHDIQRAKMQLKLLKA